MKLQEEGLPGKGEHLPSVPHGVEGKLTDAIELLVSVSWGCIVVYRWEDRHGTLSWMKTNLKLGSRVVLET